MARAPILAAGGIVFRDGGRPLIAIVQRRKDRRWVLPKGKLNVNERPLAAARREVIEETGHQVQVHEFLGVLIYQSRTAPKVVQFWRMQAADGPIRKLARDIRAVDWLPLDDAVAKLSFPVEQLFLTQVGRHALKMMNASAPAARPTLLRRILQKLERGGAGRAVLRRGA